MPYKDPAKARECNRASYAKRRDKRGGKCAPKAMSREERLARKRVARRNHEWWKVETCRNIKSRAKRAGADFNITPLDLQIPEVCPFTLKPFEFGGKNGSVSLQSPSVDRIKPDRGYVSGNVRVISMLANYAKSSITDPDVFQRLADDARLWGLV
jgi:hypothetical protein